MTNETKEYISELERKLEEARDIAKYLWGYAIMPCYSDGCPVGPDECGSCKIRRTVEGWYDA